MLLFRSLVVLGLSVLAQLPLVAASTSATIDKEVTRFEADLEKAFRSGRAKLDRLQTTHTAAAVKEAWTALQNGDDADKHFIAWHILRWDPKHNGAQQTLTSLDKPIPVENGIFTAKDAPPAPSNMKLVSTIARLDKPSVSAVLEVARPALKSYMRSNTTATKRFIKAMDRIKKGGHERLVNPVLAFYFPKEAAKEGISSGLERPNWMNPFDRYLLDNGLLAIEVGIDPPRSRNKPKAAGSGLSFPNPVDWRFPARLSIWRLEVVTSPKKPFAALVSARGADGCRISLNNGTGELKDPGGGKTLTFTYTADQAAFIAISMQGNTVQVIADGAEAAKGEWSKRYPYHSLKITDGAATSVRLRYLGEQSKPAAAEKQQAAAVPPWQSALVAQLDVELDFAFEDTPLKEVVASLNQIGEVQWQLDASAIDLGDLPMTLIGEGMSGHQIANWMQRMAGLESKQTEAGMILIWNR